MLELENGQFVNRIAIKGIVCTNIVRGGATSYSVFKTTPLEVITRIGTQFLQGNTKRMQLASQLMDAVCSDDVQKNGPMYLNGDLLIEPPDKAYVNAIDILRITGRHCGAYTYLDSKRRAVYSEVPVPVLELQTKLYEGCWFTEGILTTDPKDIELHCLFEMAEEAIKESLR